ncbi:MAG: hypothetical protein AAF958_06055 [Planctomycetota bacterium]
MKSPDATLPSNPFVEDIERRLCELGNLVTGQFPMTARQVLRGGRNVGMYFCIHGPRSVKLTAIYDQPNSQIIYYGSDGMRRESVAVGNAFAL